EAIMIVLDASVAMRSPLAEVTRKVEVGSRFEAAKSAIQGIVNQKLLFRKNDEVGIIMYGTEGTDNQLNADDDNSYKHVTVVSSAAPVTIDLAKQVLAMEAASVETPADVLDGIIVALDLMIRRTDNKKYDKRLVVITDAATRINNPSDMEVVCTMIQNLDVHLQIMCVPIMCTTKMRGNLEFGDAMSIPVYVFAKVLEATIPSLQKESQVAKQSTTYAEDDAPGKVRMERTSFAPIPFSTADQAALKLLTTRGLKVLGFVDKSQWKHGLGMTGTDAVFGDFTKPKAQEAIHALSTAMHAEGKFALARFVRVANAAPKVVAFHVREDRTLFEPALAAIHAFDKAFQLKEAAKAKDHKKKSFWSDVSIGDMKPADIHRTTLFNAFLHRAKAEFGPSNGPVWQLLVEHHVTLLSTRDDPSCDTSVREAE
ncbi:hypothetical protein DYB36_010422, partial [Aphanomyces astaci]